MNKHLKDCRNHFCTGCGPGSDNALLQKRIADMKNLLSDIANQLREDDAQASCEQWGDLLSRINNV